MSSHHECECGCEDCDDMQYEWATMVEEMKRAYRQRDIYKERWRVVEAELKQTSALLMKMTAPGHEADWPVDHRD